MSPGFGLRLVQASPVRVSVQGKLYKDNSTRVYRQSPVKSNWENALRKKLQYTTPSLIILLIAHLYQWIIKQWRNLWHKICVMACIILIHILRCLHRTGWIKTRPTQKLLVRVKFTGNSYSYRSCVNVNGHHWNTRKLVFTRTRTGTRINVNAPSHWYKYESGYPCMGFSKHQFACIQNPIAAVHNNMGSIWVQFTLQYKQFVCTVPLLATKTAKTDARKFLRQ